MLHFFIRIFLYQLKRFTLTFKIFITAPDLIFFIQINYFLTPCMVKRISLAVLPAGQQL